MAVSRQQQNRAATRKIVGTYTLNGDERNTRLTISRDLDTEPFPNCTGDEVKVELVIPSDEPAYLEVKPVMGE